MPEGRLVTSQRGVVEATAEGLDGLPRVVAVMDDGRRHVFAPHELAAGKVDRGWAVTVHRSQGATVDRAHRLADGGGRELAYVAMSRGREANVVYVQADDCRPGRRRSPSGLETRA